MKKECHAYVDRARAEAAELDRPATGYSPTGWLFGPISFRGELNKAGYDPLKPGQPKSDTSLVLPPMGLTMSNDQLCALMGFQARAVPAADDARGRNGRDETAEMKRSR